MNKMLIAAALVVGLPVSGATARNTNDKPGAAYCASGKQARQPCFCLENIYEPSCKAYLKVNLKALQDKRR